MTITQPDLSVFETLESEVRSYCRGWPTVFDRAQGSRMFDEDGHAYLDFFAGAGSLNYGHNNPVLKRALIDYLERDGVTHGLDMSTTAKRAFLESFQNIILRPRDLPYKVMFPGPTGTNAVEAALKLARKVKGRESIVSFTNAFHGMSLGSLAVTGNAFKRAGAGIPLVHGTPMPFDNYLDGTDPRLHLVRAAAGGPGLRPQPARRRDRRDGAGRGRHQRRPRRVAAQARRASASAGTCS